MIIQHIYKRTEDKNTQKTGPEIQKKNKFERGFFVNKAHFEKSLNPLLVIVWFHHRH